MDIITQARELGVAIQADPRYTFFKDIKSEMDNDESLQKKIGAFNLERMNLDKELSNDERDETTMKALNEKIKSLYSDIMSDPQMTKYEEAKKALEELIAQVNTVIEVSVNGGDPLTCDLTNCTHNCSTCGGCG
ncbi:MAG: YlbF family regulator [Ruminococcus sp.]|jgi:cell fate (sporulation/competence/biofilm development) regulator YlbF (YheA/YmcA/DUF963 family)|nr:YlbF family regulator [Ruminococcus sp.]